MTENEMLELEELRAENAKLKAAVKAAVKTSLKVSEKGAVSLYGLGRFPVTLYKSQWLNLFDKIETVKQFLTDHDSELAVKE